jgi:hypothetical protein
MFQPIPVPMSETNRLPFRHLRSGARYEVVREFVDHGRDLHPVGEQWRYRGYSFLPYHDGLSLFVSLDDVRDWQIRLQWIPEEQADIVARLEQHIREIAPPDKPTQRMPESRPGAGAPGRSGASATDDPKGPAPSALRAVGAILLLWFGLSLVIWGSLGVAFVLANQDRTGPPFAPGMLVLAGLAMTAGGGFVAVREVARLVRHWRLR